MDDIADCNDAWVIEVYLLIYLTSYLDWIFINSSMWCIRRVGCTN